MSFIYIPPTTVSATEPLLLELNATNPTTTINVDTHNKWNITVGVDSKLVVTGTLLKGNLFLIRMFHNAAVFDFDLANIKFQSNVTAPMPVINRWISLECRVLGTSLFCHQAYIEPDVS